MNNKENFMSTSKKLDIALDTLGAIDQTENQGANARASQMLSSGNGRPYY